MNIVALFDAQGGSRKVHTWLILKIIFMNGDSLQGAVSVGPDIWMYQLTDKGLEASITIRGIRYFKDKRLN